MDGGKKNIFDNMVGNVPELYNPAIVTGNHIKEYPNASCDPTKTNPNPEPSIRQRKLYIPLLSWFSESSKMSLPLVSLQYQEVFIKITFRPVRELYTINLNVSVYLS